MSEPQTRSSRGNKRSKAPWIITIVILAVLVIAGIIALVLSQQGATPGPNPTNSTSSPTITPTASPTKTGTGTATPTASPTKTPTATPTKSPAPSPTTNPAVAWADQVYGTFPTVTASGGQSQVTSVALPAGAKGGIVTVGNNAADESAFTVQVVDQNGQVIATLVDTQGDYVGTVAYGLQQTGLLGSNPSSLLITSDGNWTVEISKVGEAPRKIPATDSGDNVYLYNASGKMLTANYPLLSGTFTVTQFSGSKPQANVLIDSQGAIYSGSVSLPDGPGVLQVTAGGGYSMSIG